MTVTQVATLAVELEIVVDVILGPAGLPVAFSEAVVPQVVAATLVVALTAIRVQVV